MAKAAISIPRDLLEHFDRIVKEKGFLSRSDAIRDAVRKYIQYYEWMNEIKGERAGTIIVLYDGVKRGLIGSNDLGTRIKRIIRMHTDTIDPVFMINKKDKSKPSPS